MFQKQQNLHELFDLKISFRIVQLFFCTISRQKKRILRKTYSLMSFICLKALRIAETQKRL